MGDFAFDEDSRVVAAGPEGASAGASERASAGASAAEGVFAAELTGRWNGTAAPGWLACRATTRFVNGGYHEEDFEVWDSAGTLVAQSRQLALILPR
jgi:Thioesterase-like superfamily